MVLRGVHMLDGAWTEGPGARANRPGGREESEEEEQQGEADASWWLQDKCGTNQKKVICCLKYSFSD